MTDVNFQFKEALGVVKQSMEKCVTFLANYHVYSQLPNVDE